VFHRLEIKATLSEILSENLWESLILGHSCKENLSEFKRDLREMGVKTRI
jgi:hypothetical protein